MADNQWNPIVGRTAIIACISCMDKWVCLRPRANEPKSVRARAGEKKTICVLFSCMCNPISAGWRHLNKQFTAIAWGESYQVQCDSMKPYRLSSIDSLQVHWMDVGGFYIDIFIYFDALSFVYSFDELFLWFTCFLVQSVSSPVLVLTHYIHWVLGTMCTYSWTQLQCNTHVCVYIWLR